MVVGERVCCSEIRHTSLHPTHKTARIPGSGIAIIWKACGETAEGAEGVIEREQMSSSAESAGPGGASGSKVRANPEAPRRSLRCSCSPPSSTSPSPRTAPGRTRTVSPRCWPLRPPALGLCTGAI